MCRRLLLGVVLAACCWAEVPAPADYFGYEPGQDYELADYNEIIGYFKKLDEASERLRLVEFGRSTEGRPMYVAYISSADNLRELDRFRDISRRLALGEPSPEEASRLAGEGKAVVWIDSGLHSTEVAPAQHAPVLAHLMVTGESDEIRHIRDNVILVQVPVVNPDGHQMVVEWYRKNLKTQYELAPLPRLYQKYAGHDNNRDWFMMNLVETRHISRLLYHDWFPQIVYNQHQEPPFPARIFVPPYADPLNPNIPAPVMEGINWIGAAMKERFAREDKTGVLSYHAFDAWWNGGLRSAPAFHNMHGILTETAAGVFATPRVERREDLPKRFDNGLPTEKSSVFYQRPWLGGRWGVREAIDYMLTADFAILELAASNPRRLLQKAYDLARASIEDGENGGPFAYVIPPDQWDASSALEMLRRLQLAGITIHRAEASFTAGGKTYPAGTYVLLAGQPFRPYLIDLMEPQEYPDIPQGARGPNEGPYDVTGWTMRMSMGVAVDRVEEPFETRLTPVETIPEPGESYDHRENTSFKTVAKLLAERKRVRWGAAGEILVRGQAEGADFDNAVWELKRPRLALYGSWVPAIDMGWTRWVLDTYNVPYTLIRDKDFAADNLRERFDTILLASQDPWVILHGFRAGEAVDWRPRSMSQNAKQRPEYTGGIGLKGLANLEQFVRDGGTLIALGDAAGLPTNMFPLPLRDVAASSKPPYDCPGALIHIELNTDHPLAFGMSAETIGFSAGGGVFDVKLAGSGEPTDQEVLVAGRFAKKDLLASGWLSGESTVLGRPMLVDARHGRGRVYLFGFQPQFRGQTFGTFKLLLNAIYLASAEDL